MPSVDQSLRDLPVEEQEGAVTRILYYLNRELAVVVRKMLHFINVSWGGSVAVTVDYSVQAADEYLWVDATDGPVTITLLPSADGLAGVQLLTIKKIDSSANAVSWLAQGDDLVDGLGTAGMAAQWDLIRLRAFDGGYYIV